MVFAMYDTVQLAEIWEVRREQHKERASYVKNMIHFST